jgi:hypothetical protein
MEEVKNKESNVDSPNEEKKVTSLLETESDFSFKVGDQVINSKIRVFDDGSTQYDIPDGVDEQLFKDNVPSTQALINRANFKKNEEIRMLKEQVKTFEGNQEKSVLPNEPIVTSSGKESNNSLSYKSYGFDTEEEFAEFIIDSPEKYAKRTMELTNEMVSHITGTVSKKLENSQLEATLKNQASTDKLDYSEYQKFIQEQGLGKSGKSYSLFKKLSFADRVNNESLKEKQQKSVSYRKTGSPTNAVKSGSGKIDWNDPLA